MGGTDAADTDISYRYKTPKSVTLRNTSGFSAILNFICFSAVPPLLDEYIVTQHRSKSVKLLPQHV